MNVLTQIRAEEAAPPASDQPPSVPFRVVIGSIAILWFLNFAFITIRAIVLDFEYQDQLVFLRLQLFAIAVALTLGLWVIIRLFDRFRLPVRVGVAVVVALPVALCLAQASVTLFTPINERIITERAEAENVPLRRNEEGQLELDTAAIRASAGSDQADNTAPPAKSRFAGSRWQQLIDTGLGHYFVMLAWCALYFAMLAGERARMAERREAEFRAAARAAELRSLRYQVNPHFLFNTLNSLSSLILTGKNDRAEAMLQTLAEFYRQSLNDAPTADVTLEEEIALQRLYLEIEEMRFPKRLRTAIDVPEELLDLRVPGMILQPLVENSVKYGVARSTGPVTITISARQEYGRLVVSVTDNGPGLKDGAGETHGTGIGLANVRQRLHARFGEEAHIVSGVTGDGYATHLRIPVNTDV